MWFLFWKELSPNLTLKTTNINLSDNKEIQIPLLNQILLLKGLNEKEKEEEKEEEKKEKEKEKEEEKEEEKKRKKSNSKN